MLIFVDTTEFFSDFFLKKPEFQFLRSFLAVSHATLYVPEVVLQEVVNHYREKVHELVNGIEGNGRKLKKMVGGSREITTGINSEQAAVDYELALREILEDIGAKIIPYAEVKTEILVQRALRRRKPFDGNGHKGFRDAILWESLLGVLSLVREPVILITNNKTDFGTHGSLADDLQQDVKKLGDGSLSVKVCGRLGDFVTEYIKPGLARLQQIQDEINEGKYPAFSVPKFLDYNSHDLFDAIKDELALVDIELLTSGCHGDYVGPLHLEHVGDADEWEVSDVWEVDEKTIAIALDCKVQGLVTCTMRWMNYEDYDGCSDFPGKVYFVLHILVMLPHDDSEDYSWELTAMEMELGTNWE